MAKNVQLLYGYLSSGATGSASGSAAGYDPHSVVLLDRSATWKAPSTAAVRLILDCGSAVTPTGLGLVGGNWSEWGTCSLAHSSDGATWTPFLTLSGFPADDVDFFSVLTAAPARQYWSLYWAAPVAAPELGVFYLGTLATLATNPDLGQGGEDVYNVPEEPATSGAIIAEEYGRRVERFEMKWTGVLEAEMTAVRSIVRGEGGNKRPFFYVPRFDSGTGASGQAFLVRASSRFAWSEETTGVFNFGLVLREES